MKNLSLIAAPLTAWYDKNKRPLPWRADKNPYHVWVSEIMLQQTRIEAALGYYQRFMEALPDVQSLSRIGEEDLLKLWEGLGYYSRARNLKKAADIIVNDLGGEFPQTAAEWRKLPGIGEYTAGAIASVCFNERVPAVDGNVLRVLSRLTGSRENVLEPAVKRAFTERLTAVIPENAGSFNEGLMELGERVCLPNALPLCGDCPLRVHCTAYRKGTAAELPVRIKKTKRTKAEKTVYILRSADGEIALEKRPETGLLSGMYQLPNTDGFLDESGVLEQATEWETDPQSAVYVADVKHVFTHIDWYLKGYAVNVKRKSERFIWASPEELDTQYPLPTAFRKVLNRYPENQ